MSVSLILLNTKDPNEPFSEYFIFSLTIPSQRVKYSLLMFCLGIMIASYQLEKV